LLSNTHQGDTDQVPDYYTLMDTVTGVWASDFYRTEEEALAAQGHSELLKVEPDSGKFHGRLPGYDPKEPPKLGQRQVDPAWAMSARHQLAEYTRTYLGVAEP